MNGICFAACKLIVSANTGSRPKIPPAGDGIHKAVGRAKQLVKNLPRDRCRTSAVLALCRRNAPAHLRHAELLTLCEFYEWRTDLERERMNAFTSSLFSKEFWERMTGSPWKGRE